MNTELTCCNQLVETLAVYGVKHAVLSPGSRNAPLIKAFNDCPSISTDVVIDERSAAFYALGIALVTDNCVALVCTSGSAMLNYAPALVEAQLRHIPLLAITADRPHEVIGRNEPQTIYQQGLYSNNIKRSFNLDSRENLRYLSLVINKAISAAISYPRGAVHLNVEIPIPTISNATISTSFKTPAIIETISSAQLLDKTIAAELALQFQSPHKILIVAGAYSPNDKLNKVITRLASTDNIIVVADNIANLHLGNLNCVSMFSLSVPPSDSLLPVPDLVITYGLNSLAPSIRKYIEDNTIPHWHIGHTPDMPDNFGTISKHIEIAPENFFPQILQAMRRRELPAISFSSLWRQKAAERQSYIDAQIKEMPWCDLKAITEILYRTPRGYNIQLSNGMAIRYSQLLNRSYHRIDCNRGVSGIEGSTSTAIGASTVYSGHTMLLTGDMSCFYDLNSLFSNSKSNRLKIVVFVNGGGNIFKCIEGTRSYSDVDSYMVADPQFDLVQVAKAAGFKTFHADTWSQLQVTIPHFIKHDDAPAMLIVDTRHAPNASTYINFTKQL